MKTENIILATIVVLGGAGAYYYFTKKNEVIDKTPTTTTDQSTTATYMPEDKIKAPDVIIPPTAQVLPTAPLIVQATVINEEDINSLDCKSLLLKYTNVMNQLDKILSDGISSTSTQATLLINRKNLIEQIMASKNCAIKDPVLDTAIVNKQVEGPVKYTNSEINEIVDVFYEDLRNTLRNANDRDESTMSEYTDGQRERIAQRNNIISNSYKNSVMLKDKLKTLPTKKEVDIYVPLIKKILEGNFYFMGAPWTYDEWVKDNLTQEDVDFLKKWAFDYNQLV